MILVDAGSNEGVAWLLLFNDKVGEVVLGLDHGQSPDGLSRQRNYQACQII